MWCHNRNVPLTCSDVDGSVDQARTAFALPLSLWENLISLGTNRKGASPLANCKMTCYVYGLYQDLQCYNVLSDVTIVEFSLIQSDHFWGRFASLCSCVCVSRLPQQGQGFLPAFKALQVPLLTSLLLLLQLLSLTSIWILLLMQLCFF